MGCRCTKKDHKSKQATESQSSLRSPALQSPTNSMRVDRHYPESLQSYEPGIDETEEARLERERIRRELNAKLMLHSGSQSNGPSSANHGQTSTSSSQANKQTSCIVEPLVCGKQNEGQCCRSTQQASSTEPATISSGAVSHQTLLPPSAADKSCPNDESSRSSDNVKSKYKKMPKEMQDEIKSKSSSIQSRRLETLEGEKVIQVHATLYRTQPSTNQRSTTVATTSNVQQASGSNTEMIVQPVPKPMPQVPPATQTMTVTTTTAPPPHTFNVKSNLSANESLAAKSQVTGTQNTSLPGPVTSGAQPQTLPLPRQTTVLPGPVANQQPAATQQSTVLPGPTSATPTHQTQIQQEPKQVESQQNPPPKTEASFSASNKPAPMANTLTTSTRPSRIPVFKPNPSSSKDVNFDRPSFGSQSQVVTAQSNSAPKSPFGVARQAFGSRSAVSKPKSPFLANAPRSPFGNTASRQAFGGQGTTTAQKNQFQGTSSRPAFGAPTTSLQSLQTFGPNPTQPPANAASSGPAFGSTSQSLPPFGAPLQTSRPVFGQAPSSANQPAPFGSAPPRAPSGATSAVIADQSSPAFGAPSSSSGGTVLPFGANVQQTSGGGGQTLAVPKTTTLPFGGQQGSIKPTGTTNDVQSSQVTSNQTLPTPANQASFGGAPSDGKK